MGAGLEGQAEGCGLGPRLGSQTELCLGTSVVGNDRQGVFMPIQADRREEQFLRWAEIANHFGYDPQPELAKWMRTQCGGRW